MVRANYELRRNAVALRVKGASYRQIEAQLGVARSTLSGWLRDIELSEAHQAALDPFGPAVVSKRAASIRATWRRRRETVRATARAQTSELSEHELFTAGVVAYWAEGSKNKPWRGSSPVTFTNSDPALIQLFLAWLGLVGVDEERLVFRVAIHESADAASAVGYWSSIVGVPEDRFMRTTLKRHNPRTVRMNVRDDYHGCCIVRVRRSSTLNLQIEGWFEGIANRFGSSSQNRSAACARGPGVEPGLEDPESSVLPLHHPRPTGGHRNGGPEIGPPAPG